MKHRSRFETLKFIGSGRVQFTMKILQSRNRGGASENGTLVSLHFYLLCPRRKVVNSNAIRVSRRAPWELTMMTYPYRVLVKKRIHRYASCTVVKKEPAHTFARMFPPARTASERNDSKPCRDVLLGLRAFPCSEISPEFPRSTRARVGNLRYEMPRIPSTDSCPTFAFASPFCQTSELSSRQHNRISPNGPSNSAWKSVMILEICNDIECLLGSFAINHQYRKRSAQLHC